MAIENAPATNICYCSPCAKSLIVCVCADKKEDAFVAVLLASLCHGKSMPGGRGGIGEMNAVRGRWVNRLWSTR